MWKMWRGKKTVDEITRSLLNMVDELKGLIDSNAEEYRRVDEEIERLHAHKVVIMGENTRAKHVLNQLEIIVG